MISLIQHSEDDFLGKVKLKILNSRIILNNLCLRAVKAPARLSGCVGLFEHLLIACAIRSKISCAGYHFLSV